MIPLETQRFILRDFVESDWQAVHQYASGHEIVRYLTPIPDVAIAVTIYNLGLI
jgi:metal-sulfur cluster biosynthetic enzyme